MVSNLFIDLEGNPIPDELILGYGGTGVVIRFNDRAVKLPCRHPFSSPADFQGNICVIRHEQDVYRRLLSFPRQMWDCIVPCLEIFPNATHLAYMPNGDLAGYLEHNPRPPREVQLRWFCQMARALVQIHDKCVLVADIASRNFLLDSDLSLRLCDFSEASILPLGTDMDTVDDDGFSGKIDIGELGAVMYEVITGETLELELFRDSPTQESRARLPQRSSLPSTDGLWLGTIIDTCWTGGFQNARCLLDMLETVELEAEPDQETRYWTMMSSLPLQIFQPDVPTSFIVLSIAMAAGIVMSAWLKRKS
ncbi:serine/threonine-protein kinase HT1 [Aspergillus crustosus]